MRVVYLNLLGGIRLSSAKTPIDPLEAITPPGEHGANSNRHLQEFVAPTAEELGRLALATTTSSASLKSSEAAPSFASLLNRGSSQE